MRRFNDQKLRACLFLCWQSQRHVGMFELATIPRSSR